MRTWAYFRLRSVPSLRSPNKVLSSAVDRRKTNATNADDRPRAARMISPTIHHMASSMPELSTISARINSQPEIPDNYETVSATVQLTLAVPHSRTCHVIEGTLGSPISAIPCILEGWSLLVPFSNQPVAHSAHPGVEPAISLISTETCTGSISEDLQIRHRSFWFTDSVVHI